MQSLGNKRRRNAEPLGAQSVDRDSKGSDVAQPARLHEHTERSSDGQPPRAGHRTSLSLIDQQHARWQELRQSNGRRFPSIERFLQCRLDTSAFRSIGDDNPRSAAQQVHSRRIWSCTDHLLPDSGRHDELLIQDAQQLDVADARQTEAAWCPPRRSRSARELASKVLQVIVDSIETAARRLPQKLVQADAYQVRGT